MTQGAHHSDLHWHDQPRKRRMHRPEISMTESLVTDEKVSGRYNVLDRSPDDAYRRPAFRVSCWRGGIFISFGSISGGKNMS